MGGNRGQGRCQSPWLLGWNWNWMVYFMENHPMKILWKFGWQLHIWICQLLPHCRWCSKPSGWMSRDLAIWQVVRYQSHYLHHHSSLGSLLAQRWWVALAVQIYPCSTVQRERINISVKDHVSWYAWCFNDLLCISSMTNPVKVSWLPILWVCSLTPIASPAKCCCNVHGKASILLLPFIPSLPLGQQTLSRARDHQLKGFWCLFLLDYQKWISNWQEKQ